jgi:4-carboxymuconolactone decarboxylase
MAYEWNAHKAAALQNGVNPTIADAIAAAKRPSGMSSEMEAAYSFIDELLTTHQVTDATFQAAENNMARRALWT